MCRMDDKTRAYTEYIMKVEAQRRANDSEWNRVKIMMPITTTTNQDMTIHASEDLSIDNIQRHRNFYSKGHDTLKE